VNWNNERIFSDFYSFFPEIRCCQISKNLCNNVFNDSVKAIHEFWVKYTDKSWEETAMKLRVNFRFLRWGLFLGLFLLAACRTTELPTPVPTVSLPTALPATNEAIASESISTETAVPIPTQTAQIEVAPTNTVIPPSPLPPITPSPLPQTPTGSTNYAVVFVQSNDVLNVRSGPGVSFDIIGSLPPDANSVKIIGTGQLVSGSTWVPVQQGTVSGWVNGRFLTEVVPSQTFCSDTAVTQILDQLKTAVANQDDALFAQLIHPERGLRVRLLWHEAETRLDNQNLLSDPTSYSWGTAAGSGETIIGTPANILLPKLTADLLNATELGCNEILYGGTAGFVLLPDEYAPINFYTFYRPGTEEFAELNWGSWAVGIEKWQGLFYVSTLVHYEWEP
jgi:hypothetical protein